MNKMSQQEVRISSTQLHVRQLKKHESVYQHRQRPTDLFRFGKVHPFRVIREFPRTPHLKRTHPPHYIETYPTSFVHGRLTGFSEVIGSQFNQYDYRFLITVEVPQAITRNQAYIIGLTRIVPNMDRWDYATSHYSTHLLHVNYADVEFQDYSGPKQVASFVKVGEELGKWEYIPLAFRIKYIELRKTPSWPLLIVYGEDSSIAIPLLHRGRAVAWSECQHSTHTVKVGNCMHKTVCSRCGIECTVDTSG